MAEGNNLQVFIQQLKSYSEQTKILVDKVINMNLNSRESEGQLLHLFDPKCMKILESCEEIRHKFQSEELSIADTMPTPMEH